MNPLWAILCTALLFAAFGLLQRRATPRCGAQACEDPARRGGCGACHLKPVSRESADASR